MATAPRKTVKSNPLASIGASEKKDDTPTPKVVKPRKKRVVSAANAVAESISAASVKTNEGDTPVAKQDAAESNKKSTRSAKKSATPKAAPPKVDQSISAEEVLEREFNPKAAMVMIPAELLDDDPLVDVHALHTVKTWSQWAVLGGLIPTPIVDTVAITGVQIKMIHALCQLYHVEFKKEAALAVVSGLVGGTITTSLAGMGSVILSHLPVIGSMMKYTAQPALSYASTYALGRVFMRHFENKGTMADIDSKKLATYFKEQYARGRKMFKYEYKAQRAQHA